MGEPIIEAGKPKKNYNCQINMNRKKMNTKDYRLHQSFCFFVLIYRCITFQHLLKIENRVYTYKLKDLRKISDYRKREKKLLILFSKTFDPC